MMRHGSAYSLVLLLLVMWTSSSVSANCPSSWYNAGDGDNLPACGVETGTAF